MAKWACLSVLDCGFMKMGSLPREERSFSSKLLSVALGNRDSSSRMDQRPS